jgi:hypothetical protein
MRWLGWDWEWNRDEVWWVGGRQVYLGRIFKFRFYNDDNNFTQVPQLRKHIIRMNLTGSSPGPSNRSIHQVACCMFLVGFHDSTF